MKIRRSLLKDTVTLKTRTGEGAYGPVYADEITVRCNIDDTRRLVRDSSGDETVSELTLQLHPRTRVEGTGEVVDPMTVFLPESDVQLDEDRVTRVISAKQATLRGYPTIVEVTCA